MDADGALEQDARLELVRELGLGAERIDVRVRDGHATLTGNVRSEAESWSAADAVLRAPGIDGVSIETMIIRESPALPAGADADIARPWFPSS